MRKRDGGGNIMVRQGITGIMNIKAYTADLHSSKFIQRKTLDSGKCLEVQFSAVGPGLWSYEWR